MLLLVTDTSGKHGSVALVRADSDQIEMIESVALTGGTFSAQMVPQIAGLLEKNGFSRKEIEAFIAISGPGSFTGLRVGLAAIKALAEILQKPIVPVSLLEVVARSAGKDGKVLAALDAGRGEVYVGEYEMHGDSAERVKEQLLARGEFLALAGDVVTPDESLVNVARDAGVGVVRVAAPDAAAIARAGWVKLQAGDTVTPERLDANYIRRSDAEIFAAPRS
jgi:tRNA threonylcarbamoyladenosine biosynthesis protein TsaB